MSDTKFTKGPWEATYVEDDGEFSIGMASYLTDPGCYDPVHHIELFDCLYPEDGEQFEEAKANMFLIAAAPEMYEALKAVWLQLLQSNNDSEYAQRASEMARAAIAKADGVQA